MKTYKVHFLSDLHESVEVEAESKKEAEEKFDSGEIDLSDADELNKENVRIDLVEEVED